MKKLVMLAVAILCLSGCTHRFVDFTAISSKNVDLTRSADFKRGAKRVIGKDTSHVIVFFPVGNPNAKEALDRAIESQPGAVALLDGVVTTNWWYIPYIYGQSSVIVEGTPLIDPKLVN